MYSKRGNYELAFNSNFYYEMAFIEQLNMEFKTLNTSLQDVYIYKSKQKREDFSIFPLVHLRGLQLNN